MSAVAYSKTLAAKGAVSATPAKGLFARMWDAIVAARAAQAEREVAHYLATRYHDPKN